MNRYRMIPVVLSDHRVKPGEELVLMTNENTPDSIQYRVSTQENERAQFRPIRPITIDLEMQLVIL